MLDDGCWMMGVDDLSILVMGEWVLNTNKNNLLSFLSVVVGA